MSQEFVNNKVKRVKRSSIELEEEKAWVDFYRRVRQDSCLATEVLNQLESDPIMKRMHLALVLCCKESLRQDKARQSRNKRIGQFVRWVCRGLFLQPIFAARQALSQGASLAVECLPETHKEPAHRQVRQLQQLEPELAHGRDQFQQQTAAPQPPAVSAKSRDKATPVAPKAVQA
jgi:hypothetical protein